MALIESAGTLACVAISVAFALIVKATMFPTAPAAVILLLVSGFAAAGGGALLCSIMAFKAFRAACRGTSANIIQG